MGNNGGARVGAGRKPGGENESTRQKRAIREAMREFLYANNDTLIKKLSMDSTSLRYMYDQVIGKAQDRLDVTSQGEKINNENISVKSIALIKEYEEKLKEELTKDS